MFDDQINPLDIGDSVSQAGNQQLRKERNRRVSSTFSTYYLNAKAKDIASLASLNDLGNERDLFTTNIYKGSNILEQDQAVTAFEGNVKGRAGETIRDLVSFKTELKSLIGNLQETTHD